MKVLVGKSCHNCKMLEDWLETHRVHLPIMFAEDHMDLCREYKIQSVPALITDEDGVIMQLCSIMPYLEERVEELPKRESRQQ